MTRTKNLALLALGALLAGLGKGGLGGFGAASVAVYSQTSDETIAKRMALYVLTTYGCDMLALLLHWQDFQPSAITQLLPIAMLGVTIGNQFAGYISENHFRLIVGVVLLTTTLARGWALVSPLMMTKLLPISENLNRDWTATEGLSQLQFFVLGVLGGIASMLANTMGPLVDVILLSRKLDRSAFISCRAAFFVIINGFKLLVHGWAGNLELATCVHPEVAYFRTVLTLCGLGGVVIATPAVAAMSQGVFEASMWMLVGVVAVRMIWISCRALNLSQTSSAAAVASFLGNGAIHESSLVV